MKPCFCCKEDCFMFETNNRTCTTCNKNFCWDCLPPQMHVMTNQSLCIVCASASTPTNIKNLSFPNKCCIMYMQRAYRQLGLKLITMNSRLKEYEDDPGIIDLFCRREIEKHCEEEGIL